MLHADDVKAFGQLWHLVMIRGKVNGVDVRRVQISIREIQKDQAIAAGMEPGNLLDLKFRFWLSPKASQPAAQPKVETPAPSSTSLDTSDMDNRTLARIAQILLDFKPSSGVNDGLQTMLNITPAERQLAEKQGNYVRPDWALWMGFYPQYEHGFTFPKDAEKVKPLEIQSYITVLVNNGVDIVENRIMGDNEYEPASMKEKVPTPSYSSQTALK